MAGTLFVIHEPGSVTSDNQATQIEASLCMVENMTSDYCLIIVQWFLQDNVIHMLLTQ